LDNVSKRFPDGTVAVNEANLTIDDGEFVNLSGGQRQRVAMGRAIVRSPQAFLMDEPLSNLDAKLRVQMRTTVSRLQNRLGTTMVYVTHDQIEAMTLGDRVAVMRTGVIQQVGTPQELYEQPRNLFAAGFIGSPAMNFLPGTPTSPRPATRSSPASTRPAGPARARNSSCGGTSTRSTCSTPTTACTSPCRRSRAVGGPELIPLASTASGRAAGDRCRTRGR